MNRYHLVTYGVLSYDGSDYYKCGHYGGASVCVLPAFEFAYRTGIPFDDAMSILMLRSRGELLVETNTSMQEVFSRISAALGAGNSWTFEDQGSFTPCLIRNGDLCHLQRDAPLSSCISNEVKLKAFFVMKNVAGEVGSCNGIKFKMHSRERNRHHIPHVHVIYQNEMEASISLLDSRVLTSSQSSPKNSSKQPAAG